MLGIFEKNISPFLALFFYLCTFLQIFSNVRFYLLLDLTQRSLKTSVDSGGSRLVPVWQSDGGHCADRFSVFICVSAVDSLLVAHISADLILLLSLFNQILIFVESVCTVSPSHSGAVPFEGGSLVFFFCCWFWLDPKDHLTDHQHFQPHFVPDQQMKVSHFQFSNLSSQTLQ